MVPSMREREVGAARARARKLELALALAFVPAFVGDSSTWRSVPTFPSLSLPSFLFLCFSSSVLPLPWVRVLWSFAQVRRS